MGGENFVIKLTSYSQTVVVCLGLSNPFGGAKHHIERVDNAYLADIIATAHGRE